MSVREEEQRKKDCPSRGLGLAAAAIGVGVGAALYYLFSKRTENPDTEGSTSQNWTCEPHTLIHTKSNMVKTPNSEKSYITIMEESTTDTSMYEDDDADFINGNIDNRLSIYTISDESVNSFVPDDVSESSTRYNTSINVNLSYDTGNINSHDSQSENNHRDNIFTDDDGEEDMDIDIEVTGKMAVTVNLSNNTGNDSHGLQSDTDGSDYFFTDDGEENETAEEVEEEEEEKFYTDSDELETSNHSEASYDSETTYNSMETNSSYSEATDEAEPSNETCHSTHTNSRQMSNDDSNDDSTDEDLTQWEVTESAMGMPTYRRERLLGLIARAGGCSQLGRLYNVFFNRVAKQTSGKNRERSWSLEECAICFEIMLKDQSLVSLPCTHNFHGQCIGPWLQERQTCPVCRKAAE